jgi:hypothetical protein
MKHLLAERYMLEEPVGHGPVATVWRARDQGTGETLAVKVFARHVSADPYTVERFQRERYTLTAFLHMAHVRVRDIIAKEGVIALVTELVPGVDLHEYLDSNGPMAAAQTVEVAATVAEALAAGHDAGVVHSGIKPTNIIIEDSGQVRVTDSRVARLAYSQENIRDRVGAEYLAPEVGRGGPPLTATDVYALGALIVEMLTGSPVAQPILQGYPESQSRSRERVALPSSVPASLRPLIQACLNVDPAARPSMRDVAESLRRAVPAFGGRSAYVADDAQTPRGRRRLLHSDLRAEDALDPYWFERPMRSRTDRLLDRRYSTRLRVTIVGVGLAVLAIAALVVVANRPGGDQPRPVAQPTAPTAGSEIARSSQSGLSPPPTAVPATPEGAASFTTYWFDALSYAVKTGSTEALQAASTPDCDECNIAIRVVQDAYRDGGSLRGGTYLVRQITADAFWNADKPQLGVIFDRSPRSTIRRDGSITGVLPVEAVTRADIILSRVGDRWMMREVQHAGTFV